MEAAYLKIGNNFYKITNGSVVSINTDRRSFKNNVALPSGYSNTVEVITEKTFNDAKKQIGL